MNRPLKSAIRKTAVFLLTFIVAFSDPVAVLAASEKEESSSEYDLTEAVHISTLEDLISFAKKCNLDTWSQNKIFVLDNDIDVSNTDFEPIPTFGGIFLGQGHVIKGLSLNSGSNYIGLFRYVQEQGEIHQLSVSGTAQGEKGHSGLALLAGCNYGYINECSSSGNVTGADEAGSIAGVNELTGVIANCSSNGVVYGSHLTGGIAGNNKGSILSSTNHAFINTTASDEGIDLSSLKLDAAISDFLTTENASSVTDVGGITGCNSGIIKGCINNGSIGYQHVGYNIGGIAGRQTGYIEGCINYGLLNGRKDVGGIAGQMEPSSELEFTQSILSQLSSELDTLHQLLTRLNEDASNSSASLTGQVDILLDSVENAQNAVDTIMNNASGYFDDFSNLTDLTALPSPKPVSLEFLDQLQMPSSSPSAEPEKTPEASVTPEATAAPGTNAQPETGAASDAAASPEASATLEPAASPETGATPKPTVSSDYTNETSIQEGQFTPAPLYAAPAGCRPKVLSAPEAASSPVPESSPSPSFQWPENWPSVSGNSIKDGLNVDRKQIEEDINKVQNNVYEDASQALNDLQGNVKNQASVISSRISSSKVTLNNSFSAIILDMRKLNSMLDEQDQILLDDFQAIVNELNVIGNLLTNPDHTHPDDIYADVSDEDQLTDTTGKVMNCINNGKINGDLDVGGIAGSLSRENTLDPEGDFDLEDYDLSLNFSYRERLVIRQCKNYGNVTGKTDYVGGIAGEMNLGSIMECLSSGQITGSGAMIGGIAGYSSSTIRSSSAKCSLKGDYQIGGIAGYGTNISNCYSMVQISQGNYNLGSIAGNVSSDAVISSNYFVEGGFAGIDGVSYGGKAQPLSYEDFMASPDLPDIFNNIYLTFTADEKPVAVVTLNYGDTFHSDSLPQVPEKEGFIGSWPDFDHTSVTFDQTIDAIYTEYITTLESQQLIGKRAIVLIEGMFAPGDTFTLTQTDSKPESASFKSECWKISISSTWNGPYMIRYLIPSGMTHPQIEVFEKESWKKPQVETNGSYFIFYSDTPEFTFRCTDAPAEPGPSTLTVIFVCTSGVILILLLFYFKKRKGQKRKE